MSEFKPGDLVTPMDTSFYGFKDTMEDLMGKVLVVSQVLPDTVEKSIRAGMSGYESHYWRPDDLRLVCAAQPKSDTLAYLKEQSEAWLRIVKTLDEVYFGWNDTKHSSCDDAAVAAIKKLARKAKKPKATPETKPLQVGDLVAYDDGIGVIFDKPPHEDSEYQVTKITGRWVPYDYVKAHELKKIGSIRKKIEHLMSQLPEFENE